ncbi:hypothetical protein Trydic_g7925 [Trypoxylus dichotomus]
MHLKEGNQLGNCKLDQIIKSENYLVKQIELALLRQMNKWLKPLNQNKGRRNPLQSMENRTKCRIKKRKTENAVEGGCNTRPKEAQHTKIQ